MTKSPVDKQLSTTSSSSDAGSSAGASVKTFWLIIGLVIISLLLREVPFVSFLFTPFTQFETMLHEMSHAIACVMTGGSVTALTIVEDGNGHGGLTFTQGGIPFIYSQAGYIGETLWGCFLIALSRFPKTARWVLMGMGVLIGLSCLYFMLGGLISTPFQAIASLAWGLAISAALFWSGKKLSNHKARMLLMFLAVQSCLTSLQGVWVLLLQSFGFFPGTWSDATNMANHFFLPAPVWGLSWAAFSVFAISFTMWLTFKADQLDTKREKAKGIKLSATGSPQQIEAKQSIDDELEALRQTVDLSQPVKLKVPKKNQGKK